MSDNKVSILLLVLVFSLGLQAQPRRNSEKLFSPSVGQKFYQIAYEMANSEQLSTEEVEQAILFMTATARLDPMASYLIADMINLTTRPSEQDRLELVYRLLFDYMDSSADLEVADKAIQYMLKQLNSREEREQLLNRLLKDLGDKNPTLSSELATLLALLVAEKADTENATSYLMHAYNNNKYNSLAFEKLSELGSLE